MQLEQVHSQSSVSSPSEGPIAAAAAPKIECHEHPAKTTLWQMVKFISASLQQEVFGASAPEKTPGDAFVPIPPKHLLSIYQELINNPVQALTGIFRDFGPFAKVTAPNGIIFHVVSDPNAIKQVLMHTDRKGKDSFDKSYTLGDGGGALLGKDNLLVVSNQAWEAQHKLVAKFFSRSKYESSETIQSITRVVSDAVSDLCKRIEKSEDSALDCDLQDETALIALRVALDQIFGVKDITHEKLVELRDASRVYHRTIPREAATPFDIPHQLLANISSGEHEVVQSMTTLSSFIEELIAHETKEHSDPPTLVTIMVDAMNTTPAMLTPEQVRRNLLSFLFAGHESSGNILAYTLSQVALNSRVNEAILNEAQKPFENAESLSKLKDILSYTHALTEESLRLHPPVFLLMRRTEKTFVIETAQGTATIPEGSEVFLNVFNAQRNESFYRGAQFPVDELHPERWLQGEKNDVPDLFAFGLGPRVCIGLNLFKAEAILMIKELASHIKITPHFSDPHEGLTADFTLQREGGYPVSLTLA